MSREYMGEKNKKAWWKKQPHPKASYSVRYKRTYNGMNGWDALCHPTIKNKNKEKSEKEKQKYEEIKREYLLKKYKIVKVPVKKEYTPPILSSVEEVEAYLDVYQDCLDRIKREIDSTSDGGVQHTDLLKKYREVKGEREKFRMMNNYFTI